MSPRLSRIVFLLRNVQSGVRFYRDGLGLHLDTASPSFARLTTRDGTAVELNAAETESQCSSGYSPLITFEIEDMDHTVPRLIQFGAALDGSIQYLPYGKLASLRSPDGHMLGLYEPANLPGDARTSIAAAAAAKVHLEQTQSPSESRQSGRPTRRDDPNESNNQSKSK